jgi:hypothetical protein
MATGPGDCESPTEAVRAERSNDVSRLPLFTAADLRVARRDPSDLEGLDRQTEAAETRSDARLD